MLKKTTITLIFFIFLVLNSFNSFADISSYTSIALYTFDDDLLDFGNNSFGSLLGKTGGGINGYGTGKINNAADFERDNTTDYVNDTLPLGWANQIRTIDCWFKPETTNRQTAITIDDNSGSSRFNLEAPQADGTVMAFYYPGGTNFQLVSTSTMSAGSWTHVVVIVSTNDCRLYFNGISQANDTNCDPFSTGYHQLQFSGNEDNPPASSLFYDGLIDNCRFTDSKYTNQDVLDSYNSGNGYDFLSTTTFFDLTAVDIYDNSVINDFNATIFNGTYSQTLSTTNGTVSFINVNKNFSIKINASSYFNKEIQSYNVSNDLSQQLIQSELILNASEIVTNILINTFNISSPLQTNVTANGTARLYLKAGSYTLTGKSIGYVDVSKSITISALETQYQELKFGTSNLTIYAKDFYSNATLNNISVSVFNAGYTVISNATNGRVSFSLANTSYNITIDAVDYSYDSVNVTITQTIQNYTFYLYAKNSITATILDEDTGSLILQNVNIVFDGGGYYKTHSTSNGTSYATGLPVGSSIKMTVSSTGYSTRDFYATLTEKSHRNVEMRLSNTSSSSLRTFIVQTRDGINIPNVLVEVSKYENGSYKSIGSYYTDFAGSIQIYLSSANDYRMIFTKSDYEIYAFDIRPTDTSYTIKLTSMPEDYSSFYNKINWIIKPERNILEYGNTSFNITLSNSSGILEFFGLKSNYSQYYCVSPQANCVSNETSMGNTANIFINLLNNLSYNSITIEYWIKADGYDLYSFNYSYMIVSEYVTPGNYSIESVLRRQKDEYPAWSLPVMALVFSIVVVVGFAPYVPVVALPIIMTACLIMFTYMGYIPKAIMAIIGTVIILMFILWEKI